MSARPAADGARRARLAVPAIEALPIYQAGRSVEEVAREFGIAEVVKLASNENPLGPSPRAVEAICRAARNAHRYPDDAAPSLRGELADRHRVDIGQLVLGAGCTDLIELAVRTFAGPSDHAIVSAGSFIAYRLFLLAAGVPFSETPLSDHAIDLEAMAAAVRPETTLVFLPNPNNPTGSRFGAAALGRFLAAIPDEVVVVLDDAYVEFHVAPDVPDTVALVAARPRTIVLRSFSKAHGLAGMRLGYAITSTPLAEVMRRAHRPFAVSRPAIDAGLAALGDEEHLLRTVALTIAGRAWLATAFAALGLAALPSQANFVAVSIGRDEEAVALALALLRRGLIVRPVASFGLPGFVRVSVGTEEENRRLVAAMGELIRGGAVTLGR